MELLKYININQNSTRVTVKLLKSLINNLRLWELISRCGRIYQGEILTKRTIDCYIYAKCIAMVYIWRFLVILDYWIVEKHGDWKIYWKSWIAVNGCSFLERDPINAARIMDEVVAERMPKAWRLTTNSQTDSSTHLESDLFEMLASALLPTITILD